MDFLDGLGERMKKYTLKFLFKIFNQIDEFKIIPKTNQSLNRRSFSSTYTIT